MAAKSKWINLGDRVREKYSGFKGIAYGRTVWLDGQVQIAIRGLGLTKDGAPIDTQWFSESVVELDGVQRRAPARRR